MSEKQRVLIFIVSYNAEAFIESVLDRIPEHVWKNDSYDVEVLVIDDQSSDQTFDRVLEFIESNKRKKITLLYNPKNLGYGGNQKLGYHYALKNHFDAVVLLHGDGQYAPEYLDDMITPILNKEADVTFGSRMINKLDALRGKMPLYKWVGNQILTTSQNLLLGCQLSEFHTGYRAYSTEIFKKIRFEHNSNYFDFDTDIIIQVLDTGHKIKEIPIPTYYGDEISYVNGFLYAFKIMATTLRSRIVKLNLLYDRRFDYDFNPNQYYSLKLGYPSSHQFALDRVKDGLTVLDLGSGPGFMAEELNKRGAKVISLDQRITAATEQHSVETIEADAQEYDFSLLQRKVDIVYMLDIIEHLADPDEFLLRFRYQFGEQDDTALIITTGNIGFFIIRFGLLVGNFNYGKKGILDKDHKRLFTFQSMKRLLESTGYEVQEIHGIPAPFPNAIGKSWLSSLMLAVNRFLIFFSKTLFSYQMAFVARPLPSVDHLLERAKETSTQMIEEYKDDNHSGLGTEG
ncbi:MAG: glycosyltransferase [candidate division Zixibacteria bacterium]|nr:glycosyltransferase [Gammaproteobacteria bacterium]NIX59534.1 glycosyltransferase [candidate division Zixibacteria bacterium]